MTMTVVFHISNIQAAYKIHVGTGKSDILKVLNIFKINNFYNVMCS